MAGIDFRQSCRVRTRAVTGRTGSIWAMAPFIIPTPSQVDDRSGEFRIRSTTSIVAGGEAHPAGELLQSLIAPATCLDLPVVDHSADRGDEIRFMIIPSDHDLGGEGYRLSIDANGVLAEATTTAGLRWAVQTLRQLLPPQIFAADPGEESSWTIPAVHIVDVPRFSWRDS
jgi:hexosaminidase